METLERFARVEVKSTLRIDDRLFIGTKIGLFSRSTGENLVPVSSTPTGEVKGLGPALGGFVFVHADRQQKEICVADSSGSITRRLSVPEGEKPSCATAKGGRVLIGTKSGVFRETGDGWERLLGASLFEVIGIRELSDRISVFVKKQGNARKPALVESFDDGKTWSTTEFSDYGDVVVDADETRVVTRWRGARPRTLNKAGYKKHPITAAEFLADGGVVVVDGDKIEVAGPGRRKMEVFHPRIAEAECVHVLPDGIFFAGAQGAFLLDPLTGRAGDLAEGISNGMALGKRKKVFALDDGAVVATCTFGVFRSLDGGKVWEPVDSEWDVLDAERIARAPDGSWFLLCQRGLFWSRNNGARWDYLKPKLAHGSRHFGEFRSIAIGADRLWLGTKAGLFSAALDRPEHLAPRDEFGTASIEALGVTGTELLVAVEAGGIHALPLAGGAPELRADLQIKEGMIIPDGDAIMVIGEHKAEILGSTIAPRLPIEGGHGLHAAFAPPGLLLWDRNSGWLKTSKQHWAEVREWPKGIRSAALTGRQIVATDRDRIVTLALPDAA